MSKITFLMVFCMAPLCLFSAENGRNSYERYRVLYERNIYLRDRLPKPPAVLPQERRTILREAPPPRMKLTGIVGSGFEYTAFFEDIDSGKVKRTELLSEIYGKTIIGINIDYVEFSEEGEKFTVKIGEYVTGKTVYAEGERSAVFSAPAETPQNVGSSLEERLRQRREAELR